MEGQEQHAGTISPAPYGHLDMAALGFNAYSITVVDVEFCPHPRRQLDPRLRRRGIELRRPPGLGSTVELVAAPAVVRYIEYSSSGVSGDGVHSAPLRGSGPSKRDVACESHPRGVIDPDLKITSSLPRRSDGTLEKCTVRLGGTGVQLAGETLTASTSRTPRASVLGPESVDIADASTSRSWGLSRRPPYRPARAASTQEPTFLYPQ